MSNRPTTFLLDDDFIYWIVSLYDADGQLVDADSLPTLSYRRQSEFALGTTGVGVIKIAGTTGTYQFRHNIALDNAITVASPQVHYTESCVIGGLTYINTWSATVRSVATLTNQTAIKTVTDALPNSGALTDLATAANLATVDTVVDAVKVKTDQLTFTVTNQVDANSLTGGTSPSAVADAVWDESLSAHQTAGSTGKGLTDAAATGGDATAANQVSILAKLVAPAVVYTNPSSPNKLTIIRGDAYTDDHNHGALSWNVQKTLLGSTVRFTIRDKDDTVLLNQDSTGVSTSVSGTTAKVLLTTAATSTLTVATTHKFDAELYWSATDRFTFARGSLTVLEDQTRS